MLVTLTLNPALDVSGTVDKMVPNEKVYVRDEIHTAGGNGINAAIIAHRLGAKVLASGFLGGSNGEEIKELLSVQKIPQYFITINGSTRMNITVNNCDDHKQTRLSFSGPHILASEKKNLLQFMERFKSGDVVVIGGSLPPGIHPRFVSKMIRDFGQKGVKVIVDMPGSILKRVIESKPFLIKPNLLEFQELVDKKASSIKSILPLIRKLNIPLVCVSSVAGGAILVSKNEAVYGRIPKIKVHSTVGAGDSMVGAMVVRIEQSPNAPLEELLRWGLAASSATLIEKGMILGSKKMIQSFLPKILTKDIT